MIKNEKSVDNKKWKAIDFYLLAALVIFSSVLLFHNLDGQSMVRYDEPYYSYVDYETYLNSPNIFLPKGSLEKLYLKKPPLKTWLKYPIFKVLGFSVFSLRFLDVLMAVGSIVIAFLLGRRFFDRWAGFIAGFSLLTTDAILINWSRMNLYDSGFIFFSMLFFYFFLAFYERKGGFFLTSIALAGAFYFKHVQALLPLGLIGLYLIFDKRWKYLFSRRFWLMIVITILLIAAWVVPFQIASPAFLKTFIKAEWTVRIFKGHWSATANDHLYYFRSLSLLGNWIFFFVPSLIYTSIRFIRKKDKHLLFILLWVYIPFALLTFAQSKLDRYIYLLYPAFCLTIGIALVDLIKFLSRREHYLSRHFATMIIAIVLIFTSAQWVRSFIITESPYQTDFHIYNQFYHEHENARIYLSRMSPKDFIRAETIHLQSLDNLVWTTDKAKNLLEQIQRNDSIILTRSTYYYLVFKGALSGKDDDTRYYCFDYTKEYDFLTSTPRIKVVLFQAKSDIGKYLKKREVSYYPAEKPESLIDFSLDDDTLFVGQAAKFTLGYRINDYLLKYFTDELSESKITRRELYELFLCYARRNDRNYMYLAYRSGFKKGISDPHIYKAFLNTNFVPKVKVTGMKMPDMNLHEKCELRNLIHNWRWDDTQSPQSSLITEIEQLRNGEILLTKRDKIIKLMASRRSFPPYLKNFEFCNFNTTSDWKSRDIIEKVIICRRDSRTHRLLKNYGGEFFAFAPLESLLPMKKGSDKEFILKAGKLIYNTILPEKQVEYWNKKLGNGKLTRADIIENLLKPPKKKRKK